MFYYYNFDFTILMLKLFIASQDKTYIGIRGEHVTKTLYMYILITL